MLLATNWKYLFSMQNKHTGLQAMWRIKLCQLAFMEDVPVSVNMPIKKGEIILSILYINIQKENLKKKNYANCFSCLKNNCDRKIMWLLNSQSAHCSVHTEF